MYDFDELSMVIDRDLLTQLGAVSVDYRDSAWRSGFSVTATNSPAGGASCSSGGSCC